MERRKNFREKRIHHVLYSLPDSFSTPMVGFIHDVSSRGFSLCGSHHVKCGQEIVIKKGLSLANPLHAEVRWVRKICGNIYKAGLYIVRPQEKNVAPKKQQIRAAESRFVKAGRNC